jgi:uncharacterized lipoprotein YddW (UPF0748 family)
MADEFRINLCTIRADGSIDSHGQIDIDFYRLEDAKLVAEAIKKVKPDIEWTIDQNDVPVEITPNLSLVLQAEKRAEQDWNKRQRQKVIELNARPNEVILKSYPPLDLDVVLVKDIASYNPQNAHSVAMHIKILLKLKGHAVDSIHLERYFSTDGKLLKKSLVQSLQNLLRSKKVPPADLEQIAEDFRGFREEFKKLEAECGSRW